MLLITYANVGAPGLTSSALTFDLREVHLSTSQAPSLMQTGRRISIKLAAFVLAGWARHSEGHWIQKVLHDAIRAQKLMQGSAHPVA